MCLSFRVPAAAAGAWAKSADETALPAPDLLQVDPFEAIIDEEMEPGDILYIPPGFPHEGYSLENSLNYSVAIARLTRVSCSAALPIIFCSANWAASATPTGRTVREHPADILPRSWIACAI
jgi:50S ribosomal protein L16 3-hydroxylase